MISLLRARDPSILACNYPGIQHETEDEDENCLHVYLRLRADIQNYEELYEIRDSRTLISKIPEDSYSARYTKDGDTMNTKYDFSKIFGPDAKQDNIFNELVKPKLLKFLNGENCTLMTYGVSGSGKTYTILGTGQEPGVLPRSLEYLFKTLPKLPDQPTIKPLPNGKIIRLTEGEILKEVEIKQNILNFNWPNVDRTEHINTYRIMQSRLSADPIAFLDNISDLSLAIWVSYAEIYNEHIYDLLQPEIPNGRSKEKLKLGNTNGCTYIKNLTYVYVSSGLEAFQILQFGLNRLNYATTKLNDHSSRSHSIFTIKLAQANDGVKDEYYVSHFNFCDLAGAERVKKTLNVGERLKESNNINTSLLVLGRCIAGVRNAQKSSNHQLIPFRESKLTQIFQKALSGQEGICMIVNVNPCRTLFDETQHVLNFSAIAKKIVVVHQPKIAYRQSDVFSEFIQDRNMDMLNQENDSEICERERKIQDLKNQTAEIVNKFEVEENDQAMEENNMRAEVMTNFSNVLADYNEKFENEYNTLEIAIKKDYKRKLKAAKLDLFESMKENNDGLSYSSDSSDEEDETLNPLSLFNRKRKHSSDVETVTILSSGEEDDINFWEGKVRKQDNMISEHHKTILTLREEIKRIRFRNQELEEQLHNQVSKLEEMKEKLDAMYN